MQFCAIFFYCFFLFFHFQEDVGTYDPQRYAMSANVLRHPTGMTPAQRSRFWDDERRRLSQLNQLRPGQNNPR